MTRQCVLFQDPCGSICAHDLRRALLGPGVFVSGPLGTPCLTHLAAFEHVGSQAGRLRQPGPSRAGPENVLGHAREGPKHHFGTTGGPQTPFCSISASVLMSFYDGLFCKGLMSRKHAIYHVLATFCHPGGLPRGAHGARWEALGQFCAPGRPTGTQAGQKAAPKGPPVQGTRHGGLQASTMCPAPASQLYIYTSTPAQ